MPACAEAVLNFFKNSSSPVLFAGAGVSARAGIPTWESYLDHLARLAGRYDPLTAQIMVGRIGEGELLNAASYYFLCKKIPIAEKYANLAFPLKSGNATSISALALLPFSACITTNYDRSLHDAYAASRKKAALDFAYGDPSLRARESEARARSPR